MPFNNQNNHHFPSPDGRFYVEICPVPMRMSHEVYVPMLRRMADDAILFDPGDLWDASGIKWQEDSGMVEMSMRHYDDGRTHFRLILNLTDDLAELWNDESCILKGTLQKTGDQMSAMP